MSHPGTLKGISFERSGILLVPEDLYFSPLGCFPRRSRSQTQGYRAVRQRGCHLWWEGVCHPIRQLGLWVMPNSAEWEHTVLRWQVTGFHAREEIGANFVFQIAFVFHQLICYHGWFHLPCKAGTLNRIPGFFVGHQYLGCNAKLNQVL